MEAFSALGGQDGANVTHFEGYARIIDPHTVEAQSLGAPFFFARR